MKLIAKTFWKFETKTITLLVLTFIPLIYLIYNVSAFGFKYPFFDEWELLPLIVNSFNGSLTISDLFSFHNEHRPFFPRIIMLFTARLTGWNLSYELAINVLLGVFIFALLLFQLKRTISETSLPKLVLVIPIISLIAFSLIQWENWAWGPPMQLLLSITTSILGLLLLSNHRLTNKKFTSAVILGIIALFSFASGIAYWLAGLLTLATNHLFQNRSGAFKTIIWALIGTVLIAMYFTNFKRPAHHPEYSSFQTASNAAIYFLTYLGSPLSAQNPQLAQVLGILSLLLVILVPYILLKFYNWKIVSPYIAIILFSIINGLITTFARTGFGYIQALSSRYTSFTILIWTSEIILLCLLFLKLNTLKSKMVKNVCKISILVCLLVILLFSLISTLVGSAQLQYKHAILSNLEKDVLSASDQKPLREIYPDKFILLERINLAKQYHLSIFK